MAAAQRKSIAYSPLYDGVDAEREVAARPKRLRSRTREIIKGSAGSQIGEGGSGKGGDASNNSLPAGAAAATTEAETAPPPAEPTTKTPAQIAGPTRVLIADDDDASVETVASVVPVGRRYRPEPPSPADLATPRLYIARDLRSVEFPGWLAAYFPATGEILSRLSESDPPDGVRVTRLTPEIYADVERQCRQIWDEARGRWADAEVRERVLKMLDRFAVVRDWARRRGWPVVED